MVHIVTYMYLADHHFCVQNISNGKHREGEQVNQGQMAICNKDNTQVHNIFPQRERSENTAVLGVFFAFNTFCFFAQITRQSEPELNESII